MRQLVILHGRRAGVVGDEESRDGGARYDEGGGAQDAEEHDHAGAELCHCGMERGRRRRRRRRLGLEVELKVKPGREGCLVVLLRVCGGGVLGVFGSVGGFGEC